MYSDAVDFLGWPIHDLEKFLLNSGPKETSKHTDVYTQNGSAHHNFWSRSRFTSLQDLPLARSLQRPRAAAVRLQLGVTKIAFWMYFFLLRFLRKHKQTQKLEMAFEWNPGTSRI